jgi:lipopolysaccharide export system ATP-binding protein
MSKLECLNVVKSYRGRTVVSEASVSVSSGEVVGLLGPNGAGKTTTFYMIVGLVAPESGEILLDGISITEKPMYMRAREGVGYLPQEPSVFRRMTVEDNVLAILETMDFPSASARSERLVQLLEELGLAGKRKLLGSALSGGERRRVEITRALARDPKFILLDEPFAGIDPLAIEDIQSIIGKLKARGIGVLITDHNVRDTLNICDRGYIMIDGKVLVTGTPNEIIRNPDAVRYYLGGSFQ